jgi:transposase, IS5 family
MIEMRRAQLSFSDGLITAEVDDLREEWMAHGDAVLADEALMTTVYEALAKRRPKSRSRGRRANPAEVVLRLLILKHVRNWSYETLEREVRANLVYRDFTRVGGAKMPDAKTMGRWGAALGAAGDRTDSRENGGDRQAQGGRGGTQNARRYHRGGDQHPLPDRL